MEQRFPVDNVLLLRNFASYFQMNVYIVACALQKELFTDAIEMSSTLTIFDRQVPKKY